MPLHLGIPGAGRDFYAVDKQRVVTVTGQIDRAITIFSQYKSLAKITGAGCFVCIVRKRRPDPICGNRVDTLRAQGYCVVHVCQKARDQKCRDEKRATSA